MGPAEKRRFAKAMSFYHKDGLPPAWKQALRFAGKNGHLATMPDIVAARLATKPGDAPWETYFTTLTAEYLGFSKEGKLILIVAHGIGPMSTLDGVQKAYSWEYKDKDRNRRGGRITQQEFRDLEAGKFGTVSIIDFEEYCTRYEYPFMGVLTASEAAKDPLLQARLGPRAGEYVLAHAAYAKEWHRGQAGLDPNTEYTFADLLQKYPRDKSRGLPSSHELNGRVGADPYIIGLEDAANCCYTFGKEGGHRPIEDGYAIAHLISTGCLVHLHHEQKESLVLDVSCHEWWNGVRLVGIQAGTSAEPGIQSGPDARRLLHKYWPDLLVPVFPPDITPVGFRGLMQVGEEKQWFTQYPKRGEQMDTWEPEYVVTSMEKIGDPVLFRTTTGGYHSFFTFGVNEVVAIAPPNANGYFFVGEPENERIEGDSTHQTCMVQFYRIEADTTRHMVRASQLCHDYETLMRLLEKDYAAA